MVRVRFAPSPTGPLHIGGVRTALYNWLFARKHGGTFILRIEDTDQGRFVPGAEEYIIDSLNWLGLSPDEGIVTGGPCAPYRQSDRKAIYADYAHQLVANGKGYYAFDSEADLKALRDTYEKEGKTFKYDPSTRGQLVNSITLSPEEVERRIAAGDPWVIRLKVPAGEIVQFTDIVRGHVQYNTAELDDKVMLKADGMPTYHLANVVDDRLMNISHVIRGEEWLPSTPVHVLLYRALGWEDQMPAFVHLPLLLKPNGKGKLSKRDGAELGIPVFPLNWKDPNSGEMITGFRETGFLPDAAVNFLALLGWNDGTDKEIFTREEMIQAFSLERVHNSGARFDIEKGKWFNQQFMLALDEPALVEMVQPLLAQHGHQLEGSQLSAFIQMLRERVIFPEDFWKQGACLLEPLTGYNEEDLNKKVLKKWSPARYEQMLALQAELMALPEYNAELIKITVETFITNAGLGFGDVLPALRLAVSGAVAGPPVFDMMAFLGKQSTDERLTAFWVRCNEG